MVRRHTYAAISAVKGSIYTYTRFMVVSRNSILTIRNRLLFCGLTDMFHVYLVKRGRKHLEPAYESLIEQGSHHAL